MLAFAILLLALSPGAPPASPTPGPAVAPAAVQTEADEYTRYELLPPESAQFRILYDVTATAAGARFYFNPIRKGSEASRESVVDRMSGESLAFEVVGSDVARRTGLPDATAGTDFIRVALPRPVPAGGQVRLRIDKTYRDPASWFREGRDVVFKRTLGIPRNTVVLPAGYDVVFCNVPAQILSEPDGRVSISFVNAGPAEAPLLVRARRFSP